MSIRGALLSVLCVTASIAAVVGESTSCSCEQQQQQILSLQAQVAELQRGAVSQDDVQRLVSKAIARTVHLPNREEVSSVERVKTQGTHLQLLRKERVAALSKDETLARGANAFAEGVKDQREASAPGGVAPSRAPWCDKLRIHEENGQCVAAFTNIPATAKFVNDRITRDALLAIIGGTDTGTPNWMGSSGQDWWVWYNHARFLDRPGVYVDLAANDPMWRSNTYVFDQCLGWSGICIEPSAMHAQRLQRERTCRIVSSCISDTPTYVDFNDGAGFRGGASGVVAPGARAQLPGRSVRKLCRTLRDVLLESDSTASRSATLHVDFLSLDIEGHELPALASLNFSETLIDIIITESSSVDALLTSAGYVKEPVSPRFADMIYLRRGFRPLIEARTGQRAVDWVNMPRCNGGVCDSRSCSDGASNRTTPQIVRHT
jgi:hypothetical protein